MLTKFLSIKKCLKPGSVLKLINKGIGITLFMDFIEQNSLFEEKILVRATFKEYIQSAKSMIELVNTVK